MTYAALTLAGQRLAFALARLASTASRFRGLLLNPPLRPLATKNSRSTSGNGCWAWVASVKAVSLISKLTLSQLALTVNLAREAGCTTSGNTAPGWGHAVYFIGFPRLAWGFFPFPVKSTTVNYSGPSRLGFRLQYRAYKPAMIWRQQINGGLVGNSTRDSHRTRITTG